MNKFLDDLEGCLKGILIGGFVIYLLIFLSIEIPAFGVFLLLLVIVTFFMMWIENKEEKEEQANIDQMTTEFEKVVSRDIPKIIKKNMKQISYAYRRSVTSNSFGKKNYKKFYKELTEFLEENSPTLRKYQDEYSIDWDSDYLKDKYIKIIEKEIKKTDESFSYTEDMDPFDYEHFCAKIFQENGWDAKATQGSSDQGVDVIATKNNVTLVGQCKRFSKPVGNSAIQEVVAGMKYYGATKGVVIAPNGFTKSAEKLAKANEIELVHHSEIKDIKP